LCTKVINFSKQEEEEKVLSQRIFLSGVPINSSEEDYLLINRVSSYSKSKTLILNIPFDFQE
jgi:hypothetical protein